MHESSGLEPQWSAEALRRAELVLEAAPWADVGARALALRDSLELMMLLTRDAFELWETQLADAYPGGEYDVPIEHAETLPTEQRLAHIARLIRSTAMDYGLRTDYGAAARDLQQMGGRRYPAATSTTSPTDVTEFSNPTR